MRQFLCRLFVFFICSGSLYASIDSFDFANEEQRARYQQLTEELRCPKCQNQNLADSDSQIAADLRRELHQQLLDGKSDEAIIDFMRDRYGDFVLYKPRIQRNTLFLWLGPVGLILLVAGLLWRSRHSSSVSIEPINAGNNASLSQQKKFSLSARWTNLASLIVLLSVAAGSLLLYQHLGSLQALQITDLSQTVFARQLPPEKQQQQQDLLLSELDDWLNDHPEDERFIYMRARLLSETGVWDRAIADYTNLVARFPEQDNLLAEYAQALFLQNNRSMTPVALDLLKKTLLINPHNVTALGLLGMYAFEQKDFRGAYDLWQRLLRVIPAGSPQADTIAMGVARAKELGGFTDEPVAQTDIRLSVQVSIAALAQAKPDETVFVLLRAVNGPRMPLAAARTTVAALSQPVLLDTASSPMRSQIDLASIESFEVVARLSRSGQPMAAAGDWEGVSGALPKSQLPAQLSVSVERLIKP